LGLETAWGLVGRELIEPGVLSVEEAVHKLTVAPRQILGLPMPALAEGESANLTIFDADTRWTFTEAHIRSKSENTPFVGDELIGKPWAVYNKGQFVTNDD
jgi:dihydroorotase